MWPGAACRLRRFATRCGLSGTGELDIRGPLNGEDLPFAAPLFDHLIGAQQHRLRDGEA